MKNHTNQHQNIPITTIKTENAETGDADNTITVGDINETDATAAATASVNSSKSWPLDPHRVRMSEF